MSDESVNWLVKDGEEDPIVLRRAFTKGNVHNSALHAGELRFGGLRAAAAAQDLFVRWHVVCYPNLATA